MPYFYVYMLECADYSYYVGHTDNLEVRISQHHFGSIPGYTHDRRPLKLVWHEHFQSRDAAFRVERRIKGWSRAKKNALINGDWKLIQLLAAQ